MPKLKAEDVALVQVKDHTVIQPDGSFEQALIDGVVVRSLRLLPDDRGHFAEVFRHTDEIAEGFEVRQTSLTMSRAGVIKAFHYHLDQDDIFLPLKGTARIALVDLRVGSPTCGHAHSIFAGELYPLAVRIPAGVAHGYEVMSAEDLIMIYYTDRTWNREDEFRLPHDDPRVSFDQWGIFHR